MIKKLLAGGLFAAALTSAAVQAENPAITHVLTADPAAMVHDGRVYLYTGHDEAKDNSKFYEMHKWLVFSSDDMVNWTDHGSHMKATDFKWAKGDAWAAHTVEKTVNSIFIPPCATPPLMALPWVLRFQTAQPAPLKMPWVKP
jgi:Glycosyl hydrolases family 43.